VFVPSPPSPLRRRDFRLLLAGQTTSALGSSFTSIALGFAVLEATGSVRDVGLVLAATRLPQLLFLLAGGVAGDRLSRRAVMLWSDALRFATQATGAVLLLAHRARLWELLVLFAVHGFAQAFFNPAAFGLVPGLVPVEDLGRANALLAFGRNGSGLAGQIAGGAVVAAVGPGAAFAVDSASFLVSALALASLRPGGTLRTRPAGAFLHELADGWRAVRARPWLLAGTAHISLLNGLALVSFFALGPVVAKEALGGSLAWGTIGAGFAAGLIAGAAVAGRLQPRRPVAAALGVTALAAPELALLALRAPAPLIAVAAFAGGAQASFSGVHWASAIQRDVRSELLGRVNAFDSIGALVLAPAGYAATGLVAQAVGTGPVLWFGAAWAAVSAAVVMSLPFVRAVRKQPTPLAAVRAVA
jgi:MFS transporter